MGVEMNLIDELDIRKVMLPELVDKKTQIDQDPILHINHHKYKKHYQILFSFSFLVAGWVAVIWYYKKGSQNEDSNFTTEKISFNDTYPF
jgi:hypothetical protein